MYGYSLAQGISDSDGRLQSTLVAQRQTEAIDNHGSVPSGCFRPHSRSRCCEETHAGEQTLC